MPLRPASTTFPRQDLTGYVHEAVIRPGHFKADLILPPFRVEEQAGIFGRVPAEAEFGMPEVNKTRKGGYNRDDFELETDTYNCKVYGFEGSITEEDRAKYGRVMNLDEIKARRATNIVLRRREKRVADAIFNTTTWPLSGTTGKNVNVEWDNHSSATPRADLINPKEWIRQKTGAMSKDLTLILTENAAKNIALTADYLQAMSRAFRESAAEATESELAFYFGIGRVILVGAVYNSADDGLAESLADIWNDEYAWLGLISGGGNDLGEQCVGRTMAWSRYADLLTIEQYVEEQTEADVIRAKQAVDEKIFGNRFGVLLGNILTN